MDKKNSSIDKTVDEEESTTDRGDLDRLMEMEERLENAKLQQPVQQSSKKARAAGTAADSVASALSRSTQTVSGEITSVEPADSDKIKITVQVDEETETSALYRMPGEDEDLSGYELKLPLFRLLDYTDTSRTRLTNLRNKSVPVRKRTEDEYRVVLPDKTNSIALSIFGVWQALIRNNFFKQRSIAGHYRRDYLATTRFQFATLLSGAVGGIGGSMILSGLSGAVIGTIPAMIVSLASFMLFGIGVMSGLFLVTLAIGFVFVLAFKAVDDTQSKLKEFWPF